MTAVIARWDPTTHALEVVNCGHVEPIVLRPDGEMELLEFPKGRGLGGRRTPKPGEYSGQLASGDRLLMVSDGVIEAGRGQAGLGVEGVRGAAQRSLRRSAADTVRAVHDAVLQATDGDLTDDATAVCLWAA
jgi:serine phosphatase RsbU (regulator of sigma subunit)